MDRRLISLILITALAVGSYAAPSEQARQMLKETGVTGGLVVHLGCGDGKLTAALRASDSFIVQGLDADVTQAREYIRAAGLYGPMSAERGTGGALPYVENLVRLVVVSGDEGRVSREEILRVLCPGGVAVSLNPQSAVRNLQSADWPTYRSDAARSGRAATSIRGDLRNVWETTLGGELTPPVLRWPR